MPRTARAHPPGARHLTPVAEVRHEIGSALGAAVSSATPVSGGCISPAFRVGLKDGRVIFVKTAPAAAPAGMLGAEAASLGALAAVGAVRVPAVLAAGSGWLALEWLAPRHGSATDWRMLGEQLARLHHTRGPWYGWSEDNFIGTLPQPNGRSERWADFWTERRLLPLTRAVRPQLPDAVVDGLDALMRQLPDVLMPVEAEGASLLHGDLWSGNVHMSEAGPALIDPSSSYGHREVDLAMAALFGGVPAAFFEGYETEWPLLPGVTRRRAIYQLYYLLVHVRLFGGAWVPRVASALGAAVV